MGAGGSVSHPDPNQSHGHGGEALVVSFPNPMLTVTVPPPSPYMAPATALPWTRISHTQAITDSSGVLHVGHDNNKEVLCIARGRLPDGSIRIGARAVTASGYLKGHASIAFNGQEVQLDDCDVLLVAPNMVMAPWTIGSPPPPNAVVCGQIGNNPVFAGTAILSVNGSPDQLVVPGSVLPQGIMLALMGKQISINSGLISVLCVQPTINPSGWCPPMTNAQYWEQLARQNQALMMSRSGFGGGCSSDATAHDGTAHDGIPATAATTTANDDDGSRPTASKYSSAAISFLGRKSALPAPTQAQHGSAAGTGPNSSWLARRSRRRI